ncbi:esterase family protein [Actinomycetospora endophytica]|uniref:Esterase family protein n=1 Tax=Actinomycetospora endophytica TaxID=2291215 RepID=A0ABS8P880_9PSEU|nr:alpha/beta hydrolase family protein [Actinomycetospora endophytica]MCD2194122.1 esterase family protein [Actinomycetospora endophytica]
MFRRPRGLRAGSGRAATLAVAVTAALVSGLSGTATAAPAAPAPAGGARVVSEVVRGASEIDLQVFSPSMNATLPVTLLLPRGYANSANIPTLYALSGMDETDDKAWTKLTDLPAFAAAHDALVVLPPTAKGGMFSDWFAGGPRWETFNTVELPNLIRSQFKGSARQAVMGLSLGGHAALKYAEHQPGQWAAAASFSGIPFSSAPGISALYQKSMSDVGVNPELPWGDPNAQSAVWAAQDPATNVQNLRSTAVFISASSGVPSLTGAGDPAVAQVLQNPAAALSGAAQGSSLESAAFATSVLFAQKASASGVPVTADFPPTGVHNWPLWNQEYKKAWPTIAAALGIPA